MTVRNILYKSPAGDVYSGKPKVLTSVLVAKCLFMLGKSNMPEHVHVICMDVTAQHIHEITSAFNGKACNSVKYSYV